MFKIIVDRECGCFKRSDMTNNIELGSKDDALIKAMEMRDTMNNKFCAKHKFSMREEGNNFVIAMNV
ncbi:hypothetical protein N9X61_03955 [Sulfurimonas sp.]|nr:hypothetical protein [Sulfurimonas sp.]